MPKSDGLIGIMQSLRRLRRQVAPPGSMRESLVRAIYRPFIDRMPAQKRLRLMRDEDVIPKLVHLTSLGVENFRRAPVKRILALKLDHYGDLIVGLRAMQAVREGFPGAEITLVCGSWNEATAAALGWFDRIVCFDFFTLLNRDWLVTEADLHARYDQMADLPLDEYDLAIDFRHDPDTRPCLYRVRATFRAGFHAPREPGRPWLDLVLPISEAILGSDVVTTSLHAELRLQVLGSAVVTAFGTEPAHPVRALLKPRTLTPGGRYAVIAMGAGDPIRCWPTERYGDVGRELVERHGLEIVVIGAPSDRADVMALAALLPEGHVRTVIGLPLAELPPLLAAAALCVCNGSGISHLSAGLGVPTVCVIGGTTRMEVWHPAGAHAISVGGRTPCQPCGLRLASECPWDVACLTVVEPKHVLAACEQLLAAFDPVPCRQA